MKPKRFSLYKADIFQLSANEQNKKMTVLREKVSVMVDTVLTVASALGYSKTELWIEESNKKKDERDHMTWTTRYNFYLFILINTNMII